jgi:WD40 repeat protein/serine/threonine protein kinase/tetratricopeptide (TPR) repeat protein
MEAMITPSANPDHEREGMLLNHILELAQDERATFLNVACGNNLALRQRLEALIKAHDDAGTFLTKPAPRAGLASSSGPDAARDSAVLAVRTEAPGDHINHYKLLQKIGEGGMGVVYMAEQEEPVRRRVALKVIKLGMDTRAVVARFEAERQALAMMDHPNIAKVLDAGATDTGRPYFVMELVRGTRITDYCDQHQLSTAERLDLFTQVCRAVQHAHQKGIIHRDLKPSNILVTVNDGAAVPKVIDFGIAKAIEGRLTDKTVYTELHQFIGTPAYMSPEQAELTSVDIDTRSDIYSLGVLLYELLTGRTPFDHQELIKVGLDAMRQMIREKEPPRPSTRLSTLTEAELTTLARARQSEPPRLVHSLQGDLDWIVMKCLEKDRGRRYETANGLAVDLQRHLKNEPVMARPPSVAYQLQKLIKRNKVAFAVAGVFAATVLTGFVMLTLLLTREREAHRLTLAAEKKADSARRQAETTLEASDFAEAGRLLQSDGPEDAVAYLSAILTLNPGNRAALSQLAIVLTYHSWRPPTLRLQHKDRVTSVQFSPDGKRIVTSSWDGTAQVWDAITGQPLGNPMRHRDHVSRARFSPDGQRVVTASWDNTARVWDAETGQALSKPLQHQDEVSWAQFSPDGQRVVTASRDNTAHVWDAQTGQPLTSSLQHTDQVFFAQFSPDGKRIVTASRDHTARIWDANTGRLLTEPLRHKNWVDSALFSPDGRRIVTASVDQTARVWDAESGRALTELPPSDPVWDSAKGEWLTGRLQHGDPVWYAEFSPDGQLIVTASADKTARVWDGRTGEPQTRPLKHLDLVGTAHFSSDGARVVTASWDGTARVWDAQTGEPLGPAMEHGEHLLDAQFSPDGKRIVTASSDGSAEVWDAPLAGAVPQTLGDAGLEVIVARFSPDGKRVVTASDLGGGRVWDARTVQPLTAPFKQEGGVLFDVEFSTDGERIATVSEDYSARIWDARTGRPLTPLMKHDDRVHCVQFSADGERLVTGSADKTARIWDTRTGEQLRVLHHRDWVTFAQFSPDGKRVVTASWDHTGRIWDAQTGQQLGEPMQHRERVSCAQFSPDGRRIITASYDWSARIWDGQTGRPLTGPLQHNNRVQFAQFSPDGRRIVTASVDHTARIWDAETGKPLTELKHGGEVLSSAQFSPDGGRIVTAFTTAHLVSVATVRFSPNGQSILTASSAAQVWDVQTGQPLTPPLQCKLQQAQPGFPGDSAARLWDVGFIPPTLPDWLLPLTEALSGKRLNGKGELEPTRLDRAGVVNRIRHDLAERPDSGDGVKWGRWLLSNSQTRTISPLSTITVSNYIEDRIQAENKQSLDEAAQLAYDQPDLLRRISSLRDRLARVEFLGSNANLYAEAAQWNAVKADLAKLIEAEPNEHTNYHLLAPLLVQSRDLEGYRRHCAQVLARFGNTTNPVVAERMAKDCLILADPAIDLEQVARLADTAVTKGNGNSSFVYFEFAKALAEYRQGHFQSAIDWAQKVLAVPDQYFRDAQVNLVLAMALQKCGKLSEARAALENGAHAIGTKAPKLGSAAVGGNWWSDWIIARALLEEAKGLIEGEKPNTQ